MNKGKPPFDGREKGQRGYKDVRPPFYAGDGRDLKSWPDPKPTRKRQQEIQE